MSIEQIFEQARPESSVSELKIPRMVRGLLKCPKTLASTLFYDEEGSRLFDQICELDEYYLTRTEMAILQANIAEISAFCGPECLMVEPGSGNSRKTRLLLDHLHAPAGYVPIDISSEQLLRTASALEQEYKSLEVIPIVADFNEPFEFPHPRRRQRAQMIFFPGSTIGNFEPKDAVRFLALLRQWVELGDRLIIGVDLRKPKHILESAYNDRRGLTAEFNLNVLKRLNRELDAGFDLENFSHRAFYNELHGRIEMHLVSQSSQAVRIGHVEIRFARGETIRTEYSYKYAVDSFHEMVHAAGWSVSKLWTDSRQWFSVWGLSAA